MKRATFKTLSLITFAVSIVWISYILWAGIISNRYWEISPSEEWSVLKFLAILIPSLLLSSLTLFVKPSSYLGEKTAISEENKILEEKIRREELRKKLENLNND